MTTSERSPCGTMCVFGSIFSRKPKSSSRATICLARGEAVDAVQFFRELSRAFGQSAQIVLVVDEREAALAIEHVDLRQAVPLADLEVVEVVRRRDLDRAGSLLGIGVVVADDRDAAADQRQDDVLADQMPDPLVVRMDRNGGVAEHGLGPRRRHHDERRGIVGAEVLPSIG